MGMNVNEFVSSFVLPFSFLPLSTVFSVLLITTIVGIGCYRLRISDIYIDPMIATGRASNFTTLVVEPLRAQKLYLVRQELSQIGEEDREGPTLLYA